VFVIRGGNLNHLFSVVLPKGLSSSVVEELLVRQESSHISDDFHELSWGRVQKKIGCNLNKLFLCNITHLLLSGVE